MFMFFGSGCHEPATYSVPFAGAIPTLWLVFPDAECSNGVPVPLVEQNQQRDAGIDEVVLSCCKHTTWSQCTWGSSVQVTETSLGGHIKFKKLWEVRVRTVGGVRIYSGRSSIGRSSIGICLSWSGIRIFDRDSSHPYPHGGVKIWCVQAWPPWGNDRWIRN